MKKIIAVLSIIALLAFGAPAVMADELGTNNVGTGIIGADNQAQGQGQSLNTVDNSVNINERAFVNQGGVGYGHVINYYGKPLPTSQFRPVETLLEYGYVYNETALRSILKKGKKVLHELEVVNGPSRVARAKPQKGEERYIKIIATTKKQEGHKVIGYCTSEAENRKTSMLEVMAAAALDALEEGADVLQIIAQGASRDTIASGWGIGLSYTSASIDSDSGSVGSGGTGYSSAWAGMRDKPWIQANALKSPTPLKFKHNVAK
jgi:hypothetical protein